MIEHTARCCDAEIRELVTRRLADDEALRGSEIHVANVYDGVVVLGGSATLEAHARAFEDAASIPSVRRVRTEITTDNQEQDAA
jgi:osmotically-inducible protein OsmY